MGRNNDNLTRNDIARAIHSAVPNLSAKDSSRIVDSLLRGIRESLVKGDEVMVSGFGKFVLLDKAPRKGRNPKTGEEITISGRRVIKFRPSDVLKEEINAAPLR